MKKTYIAPAVNILELADEAGIICTSIPVSNNKKNDITFQSVQKPGVWDSSNWAEAADESAKEGK